MKLVIQQGDWTVDLSKICAMKWDETCGYPSVDVSFSENPYDEEFVARKNDTYTFEDEDYEALVQYLKFNS